MQHSINYISDSVDSMLSARVMHMFFDVSYAIAEAFFSCMMVAVCMAMFVCCLQVLSHWCLCILKWSHVTDAVGMHAAWNECGSDPC